MSEPLHILHIDDSPDHLKIMQFMLLKAGLAHDLVQCKSREEVKALLDTSNNHFDLVILDYQMGDSTSEDMLKWFEGVPVVVATVHEDDDLDSQLMKKGAADFVSKSELSPRLLKRIIRHALERQCILNQFIEESWHDPLTGLYNRRFAMREITRLIVDKRRYGRNFSLAIIDMDDLKSINDSLGHLAGDKAIKFIADAMTTVVRSGDIIARFGGDEFLMIFPNTEIADAKTSLLRFLAHLQDNSLTVDGKDYCLTASCGLVSCGEASLQSILERADAKLYQAKSACKNCVVSE
ncbi:diguanylate cyclase [Simiduia curdlanivorans]|uniref:diguanylate cyclase n=1 Tax=Simiduia curdlanivorans TaxID=1492769 RepID=A0ABV8V5W8_9GAMM|nr:diguanylate cyclase [Simiduia curdlanivorans]MDN3638618.1 diguanylate cyclase [Simiduia curdlanivorans]